MADERTEAGGVTATHSLNAPTATHTPASPTAASSRDWADQAVDLVEQAVSTVRDKAVEPAERATSAVVFGLLAAFFVLPAAVLLLIGLFRLVDNYLPGEVWSAWLLFGGIFVIVGGFFWAKRHPRAGRA
jgi:putative superfamily III holin-X